ncbi:hypothetical protein RclHR1_06520013 [Rhizophagus clarus]|uniref:Uncharacterized protein n=1 Tax=Rhizophagus clarus TaxID=94130 RepID=A0A2Z6SIT9_9GLOM|nr:hypothetical protein RclHR1_06520013 [Rhizophagus clarus]GES87488.1 hypothetical protein RCL_jg26378.t1 [Rhizophagus clarus]
MLDATNTKKRISYHLKHWLYHSEDIFIAVDTENDGKGIITELAGMAFTTDKSRRVEIIDTFHKLTEGVHPSQHSKKPHMSKGNFDAETYTALIFLDHNKIQNHEPILIREFHDWCDKVKQSINHTSDKKYIFLHWGGSEAKLFGTSEVLDVAQLYTTWLEHTDQLRSFSLTLEDAVHHLLGMEEVKFVPHRALEDAVMTATIFYIILDDI